MKIQQGDYIELKDLTEDQHNLAALAFINAGASGGRESNHYKYWQSYNFMVWNGDGDLMHYNGRNQNERMLTLHDVIGQNAINWGGAGNKIAIVNKHGSINILNNHNDMAESFAITSGTWKVVAFSPDLLAEAHEMNRAFDGSCERDIVKLSEEWSGKGLPPIGFKCEFRIKESAWIEGVLCATFEDLAWLETTHSGSRVPLIADVKFRKIETEEDERVTTLARQLCADMGTLIEMTPWKRLPLAKQNQYRDLIEMGWSKS